MDNFNALSKSAILTKLALDGYFIDLLTLNSFIKEWQIEAIYENEFGVEFFDNTSYEIVLEKLKERYNKTKEGLEGNLKEKYKNEEPSKDVPNLQNEQMVASSFQQDVQNLPQENPLSNSVETVNSSAGVQNVQNDEQVTGFSPVQTEEENINNAVSLDDLTTLAKEGEELYKKEIQNVPVAQDETHSIISNEAAQTQNVQIEDINAVSLDEIQNNVNLAGKAETQEGRKIAKPKETIMPRAMKKLIPAPASPMSCLSLNRSYDETDDAIEEGCPEEYLEEFVETSAEEPTGEYLKDEVSEIIENESFSPEEIEKADNLINNATEAKKATENTPAQNNEENTGAKTEAETKDELDLMQLAQTFAQNLTGGPSSAKDVPPADLEQIFNESYVDPFEDLQDFVRETADEENSEEYKPEEYKSLQEGVPSDLVIPEVHPTISLLPKEMNTSNLTAQDIRDIIRDEISKQSANVVPKPQNGEDIREIIREIVKQATDIAPQNAFKLDISHGTLDMIAKSIAKKIAMKLNSYYKLNSTKQNAKLQQFRERTIELKEKNQMLAEENKRLKFQLMETKETLNSYKPSLFGLFKFTGKKKKR